MSNLIPFIYINLSNSSLENINNCLKDRKKDSVHLLLNLQNCNLDDSSLKEILSCNDYNLHSLNIQNNPIDEKQTIEFIFEKYKNVYIFYDKLEIQNQNYICKKTDLEIFNLIEDLFISLEFEYSRPSIEFNILQNIPIQEKIVKVEKPKCLILNNNIFWGIDPINGYGLIVPHFKEVFFEIHHQESRNLFLYYENSIKESKKEFRFQQSEIIDIKDIYIKDWKGNEICQFKMFPLDETEYEFYKERLNSLLV